MDVLIDTSSELDGLVMSGGGDINPLYLHEEPIPQLQDVDTLRDEYDLILLRLAANRQIPIMGICRGHQIMNVAFSSINSRRGPTSSPINMAKIWSASAALSIVICFNVRFSGFMVVSHN